MLGRPGDDARRLGRGGFPSALNGRRSGTRGYAPSYMDVDKKEGPC